MNTTQRKTLARLALAVPRPMGRFCKTDPKGLEKLEAYIESYAERARPKLELPVITLVEPHARPTVLGRLIGWFGWAR